MAKTTAHVSFRFVKTKVEITDTMEEALSALTAEDMDSLGIEVDKAAEPRNKYGLPFGQVPETLVGGEFIERKTTDTLKVPATKGPLGPTRLNKYGLPLGQVPANQKKRKEAK